MHLVYSFRLNNPFLLICMSSLFISFHRFVCRILFLFFTSLLSFFERIEFCTFFFSFDFSLFYFQFPAKRFASLAANICLFFIIFNSLSFTVFLWQILFYFIFYCVTRSRNIDCTLGEQTSFDNWTFEPNDCRTHCVAGKVRQ